MSRLKHWLIGPPLSSDRAHEEKLSRPKALAIFASDALSSNAYATEEILLVLVGAGSGVLGLSVPIAIAIISLLILLILSYRQTIAKYPDGGGAYIVAKDNLGTIPGIIAGSSLLVDYILTVAVSVAAGIAAIISAAPTLLPYRIELCLLAIVILAIMNLRGIRESGNIFAIPPYLFIFSIFLLIAVGFYQLITQGRPAQPLEVHTLPAMQDLSIFLILKAFSSGCTALTGVEAISNGVPSFKEPAANNARATLATLGILATIMFGGLTLLAERLHIVPDDHGGKTVLSLINGEVFGNGSLIYWFIQIATMMILVLAANTAFNGFPLLASLIAKDGFLPRQFNRVGDRLVFSNGIIILSIAAAILLVIFGGIVTNLIPLYAIGVFTSFTLSQIGMVRRWLSQREKGWQLGTVISGIGGIVCFIVLLVFSVTKFSGGAWIVLLLMPLLVAMHLSIKRHYTSVAEQLSLAQGKPPLAIRKNRVIVPIGTMHRGVIHALQYAKAISNDVTAVCIDINSENTEKIKRKWTEWGEGVNLAVVPSPYRSTTKPLFDFINAQDTGRRDEVVTVVIPEFVAAHWWQQFLHNQTALALKWALLFRRNTVVISVPFHLDD